MENVFVSVIIPCYNEEANLLKTLTKTDDYLFGQSYTSEIIIVDDGSTDKTTEIAQKATRTEKIIITLDRNTGKGEAVKRGVEKSRGEFILFFDADFSTDIRELGKFLKASEDGGDILIASRNLPESVLDPPQPAARRVMGFFCRMLVKAIVGLKYSDTQCGFKLFKRSPARDIFPKMKTTGFAFDIELLMLARERGLSVREIPVTWRNSSSSRVSPIRDSLKFFIELLKLRYR